MRMAAPAMARGHILAFVALATGALMVTYYIRRSLRNRRRRRPEGDDDSGVDIDIGSELSVRDDDTAGRDTDDDVLDVIPSDSQERLQHVPVVGVATPEADATLRHVSEGAADMTSAEANVLTSLLTTADQDLLQRALVTIGNAAAFTKNQNLLREAGCLKQLILLVKTQAMALRVGQSVTYPAIITRVVNTVTNLAVNEENQKQLQDCIPALIDFAKCASAPESVQVSSLQALTNLSVTSSYHPPYTKLIQHLYECLDNGSHNIQLHALKVLVNLSSNPEMVPHLLAAKAPSSLLSTVVPRTDEDLLLRWVTFLANVMWTSREKQLTSTSLPTEYKAASPETMWTALYGHNNSVHLRSKVFVLSKHKHESVRYHAARIYSCLT